MKDELREYLSRPVGIIGKNGKKRCESPIECMFLRSFWMLCGTLESNALGLNVEAQADIGRSRRADFRFTRGNLKLIVECDGHEFHERTKEQAEADKGRDRELVASGYRVMRFTGSEIWRNPFNAASEVLAFMVGEQEKAA